MNFNVLEIEWYTSQTLYFLNVIDTIKIYHWLKIKSISPMTTLYSPLTNDKSLFSLDQCQLSILPWPMTTLYSPLTNDNFLFSVDQWRLSILPWPMATLYSPLTNDKIDLYPTILLLYLWKFNVYASILIL